MKKIFYVFMLFCKFGLAQDYIDYKQYHLGVIKAEKFILLDGKPVKGLLVFDSVFQKYPFAFVDDCIEAFQLALLYEQNDLAMKFIKKAMDNGFRLELLKHLKCDCLHSSVLKKNLRVHIFDSFVDSNLAELQQYEQDTFYQFVSRINKKLLKEIIRRHIIEQTYKNLGSKLAIGIKKSRNKFISVNQNNLHFFEALWKNGIYFGEKNLGLMDNMLLKATDIEYLGDNGFLTDSLLASLGLVSETYIPIITERDDYFGMSPVFTILFHNPKSFEILAPYKDEMIQMGFLHPREYAMLVVEQGSGRRRISIDKMRLTNKMKLTNFGKKLSFTSEINKLRRAYLLPPYEVDYAKHLLVNKYCLKLNFGMFNGGR